jgi:hypothetical protein
MKVSLETRAMANAVSGFDVPEQVVTVSGAIMST